MENQLQLVVKDSGLEPVEGQVLLDKFSAYEEIAKDWEIKAKAIVVTSADQVAEMKMAREGRLFLAQKRIAVEKARKELKEQSLRKGQAIDAIAKFLTSLIEPTEKYLKEQEDFVEIQAKKEAELKRIAEEKRLEAERIAKEEADKKEQERIKVENEKLKQEAIEREKALAEERAKVEAEKQKLAEEARKEREKLEAEARKQREESEKKLAIERAEREKAQKLLDSMIECPFCHKKFNVEHK